MTGDATGTVLGREVLVWRYSLEVDPGQEAYLTTLLDSDEIARAARLRFEKHRRRFIVGRGVRRLILAEYAKCEPKAIRYGFGLHGKPYLADPENARHIRFSASDSHELGGVAISSGCELGFDLEHHRSNLDFGSIAAGEFAAQEWEWLKGLPGTQQLAAFFQLWVCKEAYLKGVGVGLKGPLNQFAVLITPDAPPKLAWSKIDDATLQQWNFCCPIVDSGYAACLVMSGEERSVRSDWWSL